MVRLSDLPETDSNHLLAKATPEVGEVTWTSAPQLRESRLALLTTAGLALREDAAFDVRDAGFRVIPGSVKAGDLVMSHASVNFDRTAFQQDLNAVFPIDRVRELEAEGAIGSLASWHYAFMGAYHEPAAYEPSAREVAGLLRGDGVEVVLLIPI